VIGSGVLSLAWATAQLGWVVGPVTLMLFALITYYTSGLLADCYRTGDPVSGKRNYTYMDAVAAYLGKYYSFHFKIYGAVDFNITFVHSYYLKII
jgi:amino acid permease